MMATTHGLWGMTVGLAVATVAPETTPIALVAGFLGGVAPDFDVYAAHRRTFHAPVYGTVAALVAAAIAVAVPTVLTVAMAAGLGAGAVHALMDTAGGGLSLQPWADQPDRAVYSHFHGRWIPPRRLVRYDGAPEDLLLALGAALPLLVVGTGYYRRFVAGLLVLSAVYVLVRKRLVTLLAVVLAYVPTHLQNVVPRRLKHLDDRNS